MNWRTRLVPALGPGELRSLLGMALVIVALHLIGWGVLAGIVAPQSFQIGPGQIFGVGLGLTAYALGVLHAFDADHIAAIDNTTRKLMSSRRRPLSVGFWFSLGHSSVVFVLVMLLALGSGRWPVRLGAIRRTCSRPQPFLARPSRARSSTSSGLSI